MNYVIHSLGMPFNGDTIKTKSLGGSETAAYYLAKELADRGHRVLAFTNSQEEGIFDDVIYSWAGPVTQNAPLGEAFKQHACGTPSDVLVIQRHPLAFHKDYASKINVLQMHDLGLRRSAGPILAGGARIDLVTGVSQFHVDQMRGVYGFPQRSMAVVPNGVDLSLYEGPIFGEAAAVISQARHAGKFAMVYQSRPERGLQHLLRPGGIMETLARGGSSAHLFYCGYDNTTEQMRDFYAQLNAFGEALPNVTNLGPLTKLELAGVQRVADLLCYPTEFEEVSCITAMEAMAAGLPFLSSSVAALPETCAGSGSILLPLKDGEVDEAAFALNVQMLEVDSRQHAELKKQQIAAADSKDWVDAVDAFEDAVADAFRRRSESPARMARHLIEHSDISALDMYSKQEQQDPDIDAIASASIRELETMYAFAASPEAMADHYRHWEGVNCDRLDERGVDPIRERADLVTSTRYRGIAIFLGRSMEDKIAAGERPRVLEFGCAHGHVTLSLATEFPGADFVGMDFMDRSIDLARKSAQDAGIQNASFEVGSMDRIAELGQFDAVIAPEVVEHLPDYRDALNKLLAPVVPGGALILTTPIGRWEWVGRENWHKGRQHLHHFERQDLVELFSAFHHEILHAPAGFDPAGEAVGSWVTYVKASPGGSLGSIDYFRKLSEQAPRDTVSLCMIVKDDQKTIERAIVSVADYVDEIVIAIDETTTDRTEERIAELRSRYPNLPFRTFRAASPLDIGFDEARNATIDASCGDWIFWMDSDEEIVGAQNIIRLLRPGVFDGYAVAQHHMSQAPAERLSTDYPTRLFRRDSGARFYGVVHEHPEVEIGSAVPHCHQLGDLSIIHHGYIDEATRRARHRRNLPLLLRDLEKYPNRAINKFLYLRDLAQMIAYEGEQTGAVSDRMRGMAERGIALFDDMIDTNPMMRMVIDAVPYYSTAVATLGSGFNVKIDIESKKPEISGVAAVAKLDGMFHSVNTYSRLMARISKETTLNYEDRYI